MKIYLDSDFKCYTSPAEGRTIAKSDFFDGKCKKFIEGYRFIPDGQQWTRSDGAIFFGEMISPWRAYSVLDDYQREYEKEQYHNIVESMGQLIEEVYQNDLTQFSL